jgi:polyisoprenoid-binding protein YceI
VTITLPCVRGVIVTPDGWPLPGAAVTVVGPGGKQLGRAAADEAGAFAITVEASGQVTVILAGAGIDPAARTVLLGPDGAGDLGRIVLGSARRTALPEPGEWNIDPVHSIVRATARHLGLSRVEGRFTAFSGQIRIADPVEQSTVEATIEAASIDTGNADRDAHLRSPDFLDVERFPVLTFRGDRVERETDERWRVAGMLTIRDISRETVLDTTYLGSGPDPWGGTRIALVASTQLARKDYEINWNMGLPGGLVVVGPTLKIDLDIQAVRLPA